MNKGWQHATGQTTEVRFRIRCETTSRRAPCSLPSAGRVREGGGVANRLDHPPLPAEGREESGKLFRTGFLALLAGLLSQEDSHHREVWLSEKPDFKNCHIDGGLTAITATMTRLAPARFNMRAAS